MSKQTGELGELEFILAATKKGLVVSKPFGDNQKYDFIVDSGGKLSRVQIKSCYVKAKLKRGHGARYYDVNAACGNGDRSVRKSYQAKDVDFLVLFIKESYDFYIIPIKYVKDLKRISIFPDSTESKWSKFRGSWHVL